MGVEFTPACKAHICEGNATTSDAVLSVSKGDASRDDNLAYTIPECRLSFRGMTEQMKAARDLNNKTFIPIAIVLSIICMFIAAMITKDDLQMKWIFFGVGLRTFDMQTDWGFYSISLEDQGFQEFAIYGDETASDYDPTELLTADELVTMRRTCLAFCIIGTLLTPFDILGNLFRTDGSHSFAMLISILILAFEDIPQLHLNVKYIGIMGAGDTISVLSLIASITNIVYNIVVLLVEFGKGESPLESFA